MNVGLIGCGRMGRALVLGALNSGTLSAESLYAYDISRDALTSLQKEAEGVRAADSLHEIVTRCQTLLLCTKPGDVHNVLREIASSGTEANRILLISVAAGITISQIERSIFNHARVVRAMPNTPALIGKGAAAFTLGSTATRQDADFAEQLFSSVGKAIEVPETLMDAVTGLSGSGPAYIYVLIEALADGAVSCGLPRNQAMELAAQTVVGAAAMVQETGLHPAMLKDMVCSPGGTTIAGIEALEQNGLRSAAIQAVRAGTMRSRELGTQ